MSKFDPIRHRVEYALVLIPYRLLRILPHGGVKLIARLAGFITYAIPMFARLIRANIRTALPELSDREIRRIAKASCFHLMYNLFEFIWMDGNPKRIERCCVLPPDVTAQLQGHVARGERIIFVNPHLGSWEASGVMAPYYGNVKMVAIAKPVRNPYINNLLNHGNREKVNGLQIIFSTGAVRASVKALNAGLSVGTLIDQNTRIRDGGAFVNFFGLPVTSSLAPAALMKYCVAHHLPAVIIYGSCLRNNDDRLVAHSEYLSKPFAEYESEEAVIQELMDISQTYIRQYPEQYLWMYHRFQNIPPDLPEEIRRRYPYYAKAAPPKFFSKH